MYTRVLIGISIIAIGIAPGSAIGICCLSEFAAAYSATVRFKVKVKAKVHVQQQQ